MSKVKHNPTTERAELDATLEHLVQDLNGLVALMYQTEDLQWLRSRKTTSNDTDPGIRQRGGLSDSTGDTATDPKRGLLRHTRKRAQGQLYKISRDVEGLLRDLQRALDVWG